MDERSFDNLVRNLAPATLSRRALALAAVGLAVSLVEPAVPVTDAARRRKHGRKKSGKAGNGRQAGSGKGSGGKKPQGGHPNDCDHAAVCPRDPKTGIEGFRCPDGLCSCGGACCNKGYACFVGTEPADEQCCFDDAGASEIPEDAEFAVCPGAAAPRDTCCKSTECDNGECKSFTPGRYRRNPR